jgi:uncharacterized protein YdeI (YjbR/CyaY-like superfamily)
MKKMNSATAGKEAESKVPADLRQALTAAPKSKAQWSDLTPVERRNFISWMDKDNEPKKHMRRIEKAGLMLAAGKRSP